MSSKKICVYAICKNEEKFVDRWYNSVKEADYIVVMDTGSTDGTLQKLKSHKDIIWIQKIIDPWRFDTARNESLKLVPEDADICAVADFDQVWRPGWSEIIRKHFDEGADQVWGPIIDYDDDNNQIKRFLSRNVHANIPEWKWERAVHEGLVYTGDKQLVQVTDDNFVIEHHPDRTKSRGGYLSILERQYKENPDNIWNVIYYGCELSFHGRDEESFQVFKRGTQTCDFSPEPAIGYQVWINLGRCYLDQKNDPKEAEKCFMKAFEFGIFTRRLYKSLALAQIAQNRYKQALQNLERGLVQVPFDNEGWTEDRSNFTEQYEYFIKECRKHVYKVCVYTICKNEQKHIQKWFKQIQQADLIVIFDTGSTDKSDQIWSKLVKENNKLIYMKQNIPSEQFHFGNARNTVLELARQYTKLNDDYIYVSLDLDEFLQNDGINKIKASWQKQFDALALTTIINDQGETMTVGHKIHSNSKEWYWHRRVHEIIARDDKKQEEYIVGYPKDPVMMKHEQDLSKQRDYYGLLKKEYEVDGQNNSKTLIYIAWEAYLHQEWDRVIKFSEKCLQVLLNNKQDENYMNYEYILRCYMYLISLDVEMSNEYALKCIQIIRDGKFPDIRNLRICLYEYFDKHYRYYEAIQQLKAAYQIKERPYCWLDETSFYEQGYIEYLLAKQFHKMKDFKRFNQWKRKAASAKTSLGRELNELPPAPAFSQNKICVYAITKNEEKFVDKWYESMKEADEIVVLDTGSTDSTVEKLKAHGVEVYTQIIDPWRFDQARNISLSLVPEYCNILISTDLDEILEPGWADALRNNWVEGKHKRGFYPYTWSHLADGSNGRTFIYDKIHSIGWWWRFPVHEMLFYLENDSERTDGNEEIIDFSDIGGVHLHHYPDWTKSRSSYLPMLELRARENPEDWFGLIYLAHEYYYKNQYENSINLLQKIIDQYADHYSSLEQASCYLFMGDSYGELQKYKEAIRCYENAIQIDNTYREPYIKLSQVLAIEKDLDRAKQVMIDGIKNSYRHYTWLERDTSWTWQPYDQLCLVCYYKGDIQESALYAAKALTYEPSNERLLNNLKLCVQAIETIV